MIKPDPAIFRLALERFGIDPARCLFIDDRADNIAAAQTFGINGHIFIDTPTLENQLKILGLV